ncbi:CMRF35-like molecule 2 [Cygnus olor]|uniref:CMRF35-like molecule 2 n=1 Tax=Cygnus olor TaxID=8869 RepID=UPI001ADE25A8|nr:CMRF35-like molecule 2 [Cygnus olor]
MWPLSPALPRCPTEEMLLRALRLPRSCTAAAGFSADARGPLERSRMMGTWPGWGWLLLPACQALFAPREVSGRAGQALSLHCWYAPGYQGYNKYWCRGASRDSCRKVVETAGREVPRQRGRVSITDNHVFCLVLLTLEGLSEEDAGSYWCGVERAGRDIMTPVTIRVLPATPSPWLSDATTELLYTANITNGAAGAQRQPPGAETNSPAPLASSPPRSALSALVPTVVLLSLLAVAGSAGLIYVLWRRREGKGTQRCHCALPRHSGTHPGELSGAGAGEPGGG